MSHWHDRFQRRNLRRIIDRLTHDLTTAFPDMESFSRRNLLYMRSFAERWTDAEFVQKAVAQIPWGHSILIITKCGSVTEARFYIGQTLEQGRSRDVLAMQLKSNLYAHAGKAVHAGRDPARQPEVCLAHNERNRERFAANAACGCQRRLKWRSLIKISKQAAIRMG